jgi:hypothetical protein
LPNNFGHAVLVAEPTVKSARYGMSVAGINIGKAEWTIDIGADSYAAKASGRASGVLSVLVNGEGTVATRGAIEDGRLSPERFTSTITRDDDKSETTMALDHGEVKELAAETQKPAADRVPVTAEHRRGIVDPLSAMMIPASADGLHKDACERTLAIFDGRRRYDLKLAFKRMDKVQAGKGYAGPVAVCSVAFKPQAGHRASSKLVKYLAKGHDIELWLAPVVGAGLLVPFRASVASLLGSLVVEATEFDVTTQTAAAAPR